VFGVLFFFFGLISSRTDSSSGSDNGSIPTSLFLASATRINSSMEVQSSDPKRWIVKLIDKPRIAA